jgi:hypothetical protein
LRRESSRVEQRVRRVRRWNDESRRRRSDRERYVVRSSTASCVERARGDERVFDSLYGCRRGGDDVTQRAIFFFFFLVVFKLN